MRFLASLSFTKACLATVLMLWVGNNVLSLEIIVPNLGRLESDLLCQGQRKNVTCKNSSLVMVIMSAVYGRTQEGSTVCPYRPSNKTVNETDDSSDAADRCGEHVVTETVERRCNKKYKCVLKVDRKLFGSPCLGVYKYLKIVYKCESRESFTPTSVISASPRSTLPSTEVTAPSPSSTTRKRRRRRTTSHSTMTSTKAPKTTILTSIMPVTTSVKATTNPTTRRTTTTPKTKKTTADHYSTTYFVSTLKTSTSEDTSALSTTKPTKHDLSTGIPVIVKTNQTDNDTAEPTDRTTSTTIITTTLKTTPRSTTPEKTTTSQAPVLMPQDSEEVTWENSSTYLTIFLVSVFLAALIMALATFLVIRYKKRKRPHKQNILHKPKRYIDLPPKPKTNHSVHNNGHIPGRRPRKEGTDREHGSAPAKFSVKQSTIDSYPDIENEATKKNEEPNLHINPMFTKNGKMPHSSDGTSATSRTDGNMNVIQEKHQQFQRNTVDAPARGSCVNIESQGGGTRSCSAGNVSHGYTSNTLANSQFKRRPSAGGIPYAAAGSKDGLSRYQSTGSGPLQRAVHGNKSPRQQDPSVWPKRQINGVETVSRQVATMPASYSGTTIHTVHMPLPGQTGQGQTYSSSVSPSSSSRGAKHTVSSTNNQPYNENAQATSAHRSYDQFIPTLQLNADKASHPTSLSSRKAPSGEGQTSEPNLPSIVSNPEYDARASPIYRKTYGSPGSVRAKKSVSNAGANSYGRLGRGKEQNTSCLIMSATNPSQTGEQGTRLTASSELVSPLDSMPAGTGTNTSRLRISDRHTSLSYGQAGHSFHPPPAPSHDTVCDSSDDDLYSIVSKGKHYSCAVTDPNLSVSQYSSTALPRHDEIKYVAVRVPRKV